MPPFIPGQWYDIATHDKDSAEPVIVWVQFYLNGKPTRGVAEYNAIFDAGKWYDDDDGTELEWGPDSYAQEARLTHWSPPLPPPPQSREG